MNRQAIAAGAIGHAGPRDLVTEQIGPRPGGVRAEETLRGLAELRTARVTRP